MNSNLQKLRKQIESSNLKEVDDALSIIIRDDNRELIPDLISKLESTDNPVVRNSIAIALSDLRANEAVPILIKLIRDPKNRGFTGTLLYSLENLNCKEYFLDFIRILYEGNFENSEMSLKLIEKYGDEIELQAKQEAIKILKRNKKSLKETEKLDYVNFALKLLQKEQRKKKD